MKEGKSESIEILDNESEQVVLGSRKKIESNVSFRHESIETFS